MFRREEKRCNRFFHDHSFEYWTPLGTNLKTKSAHQVKRMRGICPDGSPPHGSIWSWSGGKLLSRVYLSPETHSMTSYPNKWPYMRSNFVCVSGSGAHLSHLHPRCLPLLQEVPEEVTPDTACCIWNGTATIPSFNKSNGIQRQPISHNARVVYLMTSKYLNISL